MNNLVNIAAVFAFVSVGVSALALVLLVITRNVRRSRRRRVREEVIIEDAANQLTRIAEQLDIGGWRHEVKRLLERIEGNTNNIMQKQK